MYIESIQMSNFRNYEVLDLKLDEGTNIFYGDNAQGKTNILEAVYLCGTTRSHRSNRDREMIRFDQEEAHIRIQMKKNEVSYRIDMHLKKNKSKGIAVNGLPIRKVRELFGILHLVFFSPEDLNIIKNGPSERRKFVDMELCQLDSVYLTDLAGYNHILDQRNKLLKDISLDQKLIDTLDVWDAQLVSYGSRIIEKRQKFIRELNLIIQEIHQNLTGGQEHLELVYEPSVSKEQLPVALAMNRERDIQMKLTSQGPHRDDICLKTNGIDIRKFGSQGQQRTAALSLKLSEIHLVKEKIKDTPVLLLDDVLSELDRYRQMYLLDSIHDIQTLITCTGLDDFVSYRFQINKVFQVVRGTVQEPKTQPEEDA